QVVVPGRRGRRVDAALARSLLPRAGGPRAAGRTVRRRSHRRHARRDVGAAQPAADAHDRSVAVRRGCIALGFCLAVAACTRADLDAITGPPDGGTDVVTPVSCPSPALQPVDAVMQTVQVGGDTRSYVLHVPPAYDGSKPVPLVVDFHAIGGTGAQWLGGSPYPDVTDPDGAVMAYPTGLAGPSGNAWNIGPCCVAGVDDVAFAKAVVAAVRAMACIDPKRVYATGFSMGGGMAHFVGCHAADVFAAVA